MLREVITKHNKARIVPFRSSMSSTAVSFFSGGGDLTATRTGTGAATYTQKDGFSRASLMFGGTVRSGGFGSYLGLGDTTGQTNSFTCVGRAYDGVAADCDVDGFFYGWDSTDLSITKSQRVASTANDPRIIWGRVTGATGAIAIGGGDFSCTRISTGTYNLTFKRPFSFGISPVVCIQPISTTLTVSAEPANYYSDSTYKTASNFRFELDNASGNATDCDFYVIVMGQDSRSDSGKNRNPVQNSQRKPRIVVAQVINTGGTWSWGIGGTAGALDFASSITDNGAGDFSITLSEKYIREPAVLACTTTQRAIVHSNVASTGVIRILTKAANGTNTDVNGITNIFIIGSDDPSEY